MPGPDRRPRPPDPDPPGRATELAPTPECWCEDACRYLDMMLDRREEERRLEEAEEEPPRRGKKA